jgi:Uma2 family endonuclease
MATEVLEQIANEPSLTRRRAPIEEFWALPESLLHIEYINGEIVMAPTPTVPHQRAVRGMLSTLQQFVEKHDLGEMFVSPLDVVLPSGEVVQPDLFFLNTKQAERVRAAKRVNDAPTFLIEILSPGSITHDTISKRALYEKNGVREYWIVDVDKRSIAQLVLHKKHYTLTELGEREAILGAVLAGFEMNVGELIGL